MNKTKTFFGLACAGLFLFTINTAFAVSRDVELRLEPFLLQPGAELKAIGYTDLKTNDQLVVKVKIKNPTAQKIISAQSWLTYDPTKLEGLQIDDTGTDFDLVTPGESKFTPTEKLIKLGRGNTQGGTDKKEILVTTLNFKVISTTANDRTTLGFFEFKPDDFGKTNVNIMADDFAFNVHKNTAPKNLNLILNYTGQPVVTPNDNNTPTPPPQTQTTTLPVPQNLQLSTTGNSLTLTWDYEESPSVTCFYIYYTKQKDLYLNRKKTPKITTFTFNNLQKGDTYWFVMTSCNDQKEESAYSQEVHATVGAELIASSFLPGILQANLTDQDNEASLTVPKQTGQTQTGPKETIIILSLILAFLVGGASLGVAKWREGKNS